MAVDDMYLDNLQEFILDEDKIVTYKWLSKTLCVHVNQAKQMLYTFATKQKKTKSPVCVTYLVCGQQSTKDGNRVQKVAIVREEELEDAKSRLDKVGSVHVYSVHKSHLRNSNALYTTDYDITKESLNESNKFSAIQCDKARPRSRKDLEDLAKTSSSSSSTQDKQTTATKKSSEKKTESGETTNSKTTTKEVTKPKKGKAGIADMFSRAKAKQTKPKEEQEGDGGNNTTKDEKPKKQTSSKPKAKGVGAFFGKADPKKQEKVEKKDSPEPEEKPKEDEKVTKKEKTPPGKSKKRQPTKTVVSDSEEEIEKQPKKKRRRRVKEMSDSSDEEMTVDSPVQPPSPSPPPSPVKERSPPSDDEEQTELNTSSSGHRRKKRVMKSKMFMDEDGCMVGIGCHLEVSQDVSSFHHYTWHQGQYQANHVFVSFEMTHPTNFVKRLLS
ncbi:uncharacterized protein LOC144451579 isoform X3 [Glandiceps talaboti]